MSDISPKRRRRCGENPEEIYRLLRSVSLRWLVLEARALYAGIYTSQGISGRVYVGELSQWLWLPTADGLRP